ncbi:hypothetical protein Tco_0388403, partial [Tanacetum coccineum]
MSEEPNKPSYADDPVPDVTHDLGNKAYFMGLVYKIREIGEAKAAAVAADTATAARHLEEEKRKGIEE